MACAQVIETSVNTNNSPSQDYTTNPYDHSNRNIDSPGFKPFTVIRQLKRVNIQAKDLLTFYITCVRPVAEYACPVFHNALPAYLSAELKKLQKHATRIIFPFMPYKVALATAVLPSMYERRETITAKLFKDVISNPDHKLHSLLPTRNQSKYSLRNNRTYHLPEAKTNRLKNTFIYSNCR